MKTNNINNSLNIKNLLNSIIDMAYKGQEGHVPSALSILDIVYVLYFKYLNLNSIKAKKNNRDIFVLSKGHGCLALYSVLAEKKFFNKKELLTFCKFNSNFGGHPDMLKIPGVEFSTGSLGHGLPMSAGLALSSKINRNKNKIIALIGDGECNEGSIWETFLLAYSNNLNNLTCIIDLNNSGERAVKLISLKKKIKTFGWKTYEIDGHNHNQILKVLRLPSNQPKAIIAKTVKGKRIKIMENNPEWHHKNINKETYLKLKQEINEKTIY